MATDVLHKKSVSNLDKSQKLLLYLNTSLNGCDDKTKLAKLQYFCDFISKAFYDSSISGEDYRYQKNKQGPLAFKYNRDLDKLVEDGFLERDGKYHHKPNIGLGALKAEFSSNEIKVMDYVLSKYGKLNWRELMNISHEQVPYKSAMDMSEIPLFTAYNLVDDYCDFVK